MLNRIDPSTLEFHSVKEGEETRCLIPVKEMMKVELIIRSPKPVDVFWINAEGVSFPVTCGVDVNYRGKLDVGAVEIVGATSFWYRCHQSRWFDLVDPVPMKIELVQTDQDVLKAMIDERLRQYKAAYEIDRELSDDEVDELVLDIASGDLEFEPMPDEFGLGYEERLEQFAKRHAEQKDQAPEPAPGASSVAGEPPAPPAAGGNSSST